jgi:hypothetical protein
MVQEDRIEDAYAQLAPVLAQRTRFRFLDLVGEAVGSGPLPAVNAFLERIAVEKTEGGWVVMASAMARQLDWDPDGVLARCREYVIYAAIWYATDIFGERIPGPALVADFQETLTRLVSWRQDSSPWVRRTLGTAVHFWTKRSLGVPAKAGQAKTLLEFLEPMFEERDLDAVKGIGWGLKTLGRNYPELVVEWLAKQVVRRHRPHRALMLRKALTHLSPEQRDRATGGKRR